MRQERNRAPHPHEARWLAIALHGDGDARRPPWNIPPAGPIVQAGVARCTNITICKYLIFFITTAEIPVISNFTQTVCVKSFSTPVSSRRTFTSPLTILSGSRGLPAAAPVRKPPQGARIRQAMRFFLPPAEGSGSFNVPPPALALSSISAMDRKNRRRFSSSIRS